MIGAQLPGRQVQAAGLTARAASANPGVPASSLPLRTAEPSVARRPGDRPIYVAGRRGFDLSHQARSARTVRRTRPLQASQNFPEAQRGHTRSSALSRSGSQWRLKGRCQNWQRSAFINPSGEDVVSAGVFLGLALFTAQQLSREPSDTSAKASGRPFESSKTELQKKRQPETPEKSVTAQLPRVKEPGAVPIRPQALQSPAESEEPESSATWAKDYVPNVAAWWKREKEGEWTAYTVNEGAELEEVVPVPPPSEEVVVEASEASPESSAETVEAGVELEVADPAAVSAEGVEHEAEEGSVEAAEASVKALEVSAKASVEAVEASLEGSVKAVEASVKASVEAVETAVEEAKASVEAAVKAVEASEEALVDAVEADGETSQKDSEEPALEEIAAEANVKDAVTDLEELSFKTAGEELAPKALGEESGPKAIGEDLAAEVVEVVEEASEEAASASETWAAAAMELVSFATSEGTEASETLEPDTITESDEESVEEVLAVSDEVSSDRDESEQEYLDATVPAVSAEVSEALDEIVTPWAGDLLTPAASHNEISPANEHHVTDPEPEVAAPVPAFVEEEKVLVEEKKVPEEKILVAAVGPTEDDTDTVSEKAAEQLGVTSNPYVTMAAGGGGVPPGTVNGANGSAIENKSLRELAEFVTATASELLREPDSMVGGGGGYGGSGDGSSGYTRGSSSTAGKAASKTPEEDNGRLGSLDQTVADLLNPFSPEGEKEASGSVPAAAAQAVQAPTTEVTEEKKAEAAPAAEDAKGPAVPAEAKEPQVDTVVLYYETGWKKAFLHFDADGKGWTVAPGVAMEDKEDPLDASKTVKVVAVPASQLEFVLTNGKDNWDSPFGGGNYKIKSPGKYRVSNGKISPLK